MNEINVSIKTEWLNVDLEVIGIAVGWVDVDSLSSISLSWIISSRYLKLYITTSL